MKELPEVLLINKPAGMTSFDIIRVLRKKHTAAGGQGRLKVGHAGTLDPLATGLMILGVGQGTKKLTGFVKLDKEYIAEVRIGESRTTGDLEGEILEEKVVVQILESDIISAVQSMVGTLRLPVSAYSAIKIDGKPMYKRARDAEKTGEVVTEVPIRDMVVHEAEVLQIEQGTERCVVTVRFFVASGVYIRSLGEELGKRLGYPAVLQSLCRTKVGEFTLKEASVLEAL